MAVIKFAAGTRSYIICEINISRFLKRKLAEYRHFKTVEHHQLGWNRLPPTELKLLQSTNRFRLLRQLETIFYSYLYDTIRYDTRCHLNVRSKANIIQLNLLHGTNTDSGKQTDDCFVMRHGDTGT